VKTNVYDGSQIIPLSRSITQQEKRLRKIYSREFRLQIDRMNESAITNNSRHLRAELKHGGWNLGHVGLPGALICTEGIVRDVQRSNAMRGNVLADSSAT
ncbi:MAG: hypothetical protein KAU31_14925, partial [Spirochaetaceae bacterium]|nr:hypothetical protein [Spirochaetaceae bacterium]